MPELRIHSLSFSFDSSRFLIENANVHLLPGWTGLVGANGCGKSTLLRILARDLPPDHGDLVTKPTGLHSHFCPQDLAAPSSDVREFSLSTDNDARRLRAQLQLSKAPLERWETLSAGERKRWQIGTALVSNAEVLLLDEPANHLDAESRQLLVRSLKSFHGIGVIVSHDREMLQVLCSRTLWLERGKLDVLDLPYAEAKLERDRRTQQKLQHREDQYKIARQTERRLHEARENQRAADRNKRIKKSQRKDSDARTIGAKTVKAWAEASIGRQVEVLRKAHEKAKEQIEPWNHDTPLGRSIFVNFQKAPMPILLRHGNFSVSREDRIHIQGRNGAGKSTLLRNLMESCKIPADRVLWMPQELTAKQVETLVQEFHSMPPDQKGRLGHLLAALGVAPAVIAASKGELSAGEARKLMLAMGLNREVWLLVLDEPTNHLDLPSVERLEEALSNFPGAIVLVCHDNAFAKHCTKGEWLF